MKRIRFVEAHRGHVVGDVVDVDEVSGPDCERLVSRGLAVDADEEHDDGVQAEDEVVEGDEEAEDLDEAEEVNDEVENLESELPETD